MSSRTRYFRAPGSDSAPVRLEGAALSEISVFVDESGGQDGHSRYYALTLVFHNQSDDIMPEVEKYRRGLASRGLADVPLHAGPLLTGHDAYEGMDLRVRKGYLTLFFQLLQHLPVRYRTFVYRRSELSGRDAFVARMRRDIVDLIFDNLAYFQSFDEVKVYYDNGQEIVAQALHGAIEYAISKNSLLFRRTRAADYVLEQAADMLCTLELTAVKLRNGEATRTDRKFFGDAHSFKNNYMKAMKRKRMS